MENNFKPLFKEKKHEQYYYENGNWIKCDESKIECLFGQWIMSKGTQKMTDEFGFLIFGNNI